MFHLESHKEMMLYKLQTEQNRKCRYLSFDEFFNQYMTEQLEHDPTYNKQEEDRDI